MPGPMSAPIKDKDLTTNVGLRTNLHENGRLRTGKTAVTKGKPMPTGRQTNRRKS